MAVQIDGSQGSVIATRGDYSGNVTIGGTLTYEDVTNIDAVGLITARSGIKVNTGEILVGSAASISVDGNSIFSGITTSHQVLISDTATQYTPSGLLTIIGDDNSNGPEAYLQVNNNNTTDNIGALWYGNNVDKTLVKLAGHTHTANNTADFTISTTEAGTTAERVRVGYGGSVGIGVASAETILHLEASSPKVPTIKLQRSGTTIGGSIGVRDESNDKGLTYLAKDGNSAYAGHVFQVNDGTTTTEAFRIYKDGNLSLGGVAVPRSRLDVFESTTGDQTAIRVGNTNTPSSANDRRIEFVDGTGTTEGTNKFTYGYIQGYRAGGANSGDLIFGIKRNNADAPSEAMRLDDTGRLLIGAPDPVTTSNLTPALQVQGVNASASSLTVIRNSNDDGQPYITLSKSRGTSVGSNTSVADGDNVGEIRFTAADGTDHANTVARILARVSGTPGSNDTPGMLRFYTTADGSGSSTERMRINSNGRVQIATTAAPDDTTDKLYVNALVRFGNWVIGNLPGTTNNSTGCILLHRMDGNTQGGHVSGMLTINSYTGQSTLFFDVNAYYTNDSVSGNATKHSSSAASTLKLVTVELDDGSDYMAIKKDGGGSGTSSINAYFSTNIHSNGGVREIQSGYTVTATHVTW